MTEAQAILKLIEEVDPKDKDTLDEIDARVTFWRNCITFEKSIKFTDNCSESLKGKVKCWRTKEWGDVHRWLWNLPKDALPHYPYTRSRDALKKIRPIWAYEFIGGGKYNIAELIYQEKIDSDEQVIFTSPELPTEHLSELYVIIQAIQYELDNDIF